MMELKLKDMENQNLPVPQGGKELAHLMLFQQAAMNSQSNLLIHLADQRRQDDNSKQEIREDKQNQFFALIFLFLIVFILSLSGMFIFLK